jgi:hypothetical protein
MQSRQNSRELYAGHATVSGHTYYTRSILLRSAQRCSRLHSCLIPKLDILKPFTSADMTRLSILSLLASCASLLTSTAASPLQARAALTQVTNFGSNPSNTYERLAGCSKHKLTLVQEDVHLRSEQREAQPRDHCCDSLLHWNSKRILPRIAVRSIG